MEPHDNPVLGDTAPVQLFRLITTLAAHLRVRMDHRLAAIGLTTQQAAVLSVVEAAAEPPTLGEVASLLGSSHQNARQIAAALHRKGLLEIAVDPRDRRARRLMVTPAVAALFAGRDPSDHLAVEQWMSALSNEEQTQAVQLLRRVLADLQSAGQSPGGA